MLWNCRLKISNRELAKLRAKIIKMLGCKRKNVSHMSAKDKVTREKNLFWSKHATNQFYLCLL